MKNRIEQIIDTVKYGLKHNIDDEDILEGVRILLQDAVECQPNHDGNKWSTDRDERNWNLSDIESGQW